MLRLSILLGLVLSLVVSGGSVWAQPRPQVRLPDANGDGHPLFGNPQIRTFSIERPGHENATSVSFGDLDGDGDLDAVVTGVSDNFLVSGNNSVAVLMNQGDGVFSRAVMYDAGREPNHTAIVDLNGDGLNDFVVANASSRSVSVFINNGDGTFATSVPYGSGNSPRSVVSADFDNDGDMDLATLNTIPNEVGILLNEGDGTFAAVIRVDAVSVTQRGRQNTQFASPGPILATGDFDGDGLADLAVPANRGIRILLGLGGGAFKPSIWYETSVGLGSVRSVAVGDLDGDGDLDLAAAIDSGFFETPGASVVFNNGDGTFGEPVGYAVGTTAQSIGFKTISVSVGDVDGDGDLDLAFGLFWGFGVALLRNNGDGTFAPREVSYIRSRPWFVAFADVNGDGWQDLAVISPFVRSMLTVLLNDGAGSLLAVEETPERASVLTSPFPWVSPRSVESADLDGDGDQDIAVAISAWEEPSSVIVMLNDGSGAFDQITPNLLGPVGASSAEHVVIADLNGDGILDLAVADTIDQGGWNREGTVWILMGTGGGAFMPALPYQLDGLFPMHVATGDLDGDGDTDLAVWASELSPGNNRTPVDRRVVIMRNDGTGVFQFAGEYTVGTAEWLLPFGAVGVGDLDGDGDLDMAATMGPRHVDGLLTIFLNDGTGSFPIQSSLPLGAQPQSLVMADLDRDGDLDLAVLHDHNHSLEVVLDEPYLTVLFNDGKAGFAQRDEYFDSTVLTFGELTAADLNGDGELDLALPDALSSVRVLLNEGRGIFATGVYYGTGSLPTAVAAADFDGDGRIDLVTSNSLGSNTTLLRNLGSPFCYADCDTSTGPGVLDMADFLCFQTAFMNADPYACDCDTTTGPLVCDLFDFLCFQGAFVGGCP